MISSKSSPALPMLAVEGAAYARGLAQGRAHRQTFPEGLRALASLPLLPTWLPARTRLVQTGLRALGALYLKRDREPLSTRLKGENGAFLDGIAAGAELSAAEIYGLNAFESESCHFGFSMGCTALAFSSEQTESGKPALAYNHDFPPAFQPFLLLRRNAPTVGYRSLVVTYPSLIGAICGVNEAGLAATVNQAYATDLSRTRPATFVTMLLQDCLSQCSTVSEAVALIRDTPASNGALISLIDKKDGRAGVEISGTRSEVRSQPGDEILYSFNKYQRSAMIDVEVPVGSVATGLLEGYDMHRCNLTRKLRFLALKRRQRLDQPAIKAMMSDHGGRVGSADTICRHRDPLSETIFSAILCPSDGAIFALLGKPCKQRYRRYSLEDAGPKSHTRPRA